MPLESFFETISFGIIVGAATFSIFWFLDKINDQDDRGNIFTT